VAARRLLGPEAAPGLGRRLRLAVWQVLVLDSPWAMARHVAQRLTTVGYHDIVAGERPGLRAQREGLT
jgi:hypothetical protein